MGISASAVSRDRTVDVNATENSTTAAAAASDQSVITASNASANRRKPYRASSEASSSSADEMSENGESSSSSSEGRTSERERIDTTTMADDRAAAASSSSSTGAADESASEVTDRSRRTSTKADAKSLAEFREELRVKREQRRTAIADMKNELKQLRHDLAAERQINAQLREARGENAVQVVDQVDGALADVVDDAVDQQPPPNVERMLRMQLANVNHQLQLVNGDVLSLNAELEITQKQVVTLKEVISVSKDVVNIRETQLEQLKAKLKEIEDSMAERELTIMSDQLRIEYDRQLTNIRSLRTLYEERARVSAAEKENLMRQLETKRTELVTESEKSQSLESRVATLESELRDTATNLTNVKDDLIDCKAEKKGLEEETAVINQLFSQVLSGFNGGNDLNIDKLATMLEDNRDLLSELTSNEPCKNQAAAMPKLLLDLMSQIDENASDSSGENEIPESVPDTPIVETPLDDLPQAVCKKVEILTNLPKVWKVLIELLNHQKAETVPFNENGAGEDCYNVVQSPSGPEQVLSVSKTYIRLKNLILEKKFLQKETNKLKNLNNHLESRLDQKERRLAAVTVELNKTWTLVGRMQRQHRQLHTNEQVLRYQLSQKRRMLNELKEELEYCRRKWTLARAKNDETQTQWTALRREFTARKLQDLGSQLSAESGYSDDPVSDEDGADDETPPLSATVEPEVEKNTVELVQAADEVLVEQPLVVQLASIPEPVAGTSAALAAGSTASSKESASTKRDPRKKKTKSPAKTKTSGAESLEAMFYRISGLAQPEDAESSSDDSDSDYDDDAVVEYAHADDAEESVPSVEESAQTDIGTPEEENTIIQPSTSVLVDSEDEERRQRRVVRFERLESQCQQLIQQVLRNSTRGEELNRQLDNVQNRYKTPTRETSAEPSTSAAATLADSASASATESTPLDTATEERLLTPREQEYTSRRTARLLRLEEETREFMERMSQRNARATTLNDRATEIHEHHSARLAGPILDAVQPTALSETITEVPTDSLPLTNPEPQANTTELIDTEPNLPTTVADSPQTPTPTTDANDSPSFTHNQ